MIDKSVSLAATAVFFIVGLIVSAIAIYVVPKLIGDGHATANIFDEAKLAPLVRTDLCNLRELGFEAWHRSPLSPLTLTPHPSSNEQFEDHD